MTIVTSGQLIEDLIEEAKKIVGLERFENKKIRWQWVDDMTMFTEEQANAYAVKTADKNNYVVYFPKSFMTINWNIFADDISVDEMGFDYEGNPEPQYVQEWRLINEAWLMHVMITILHEFLRIVKKNMSHQELHRRSEEFAKQYIQNNKIRKSSSQIA